MPRGGKRNGAGAPKGNSNAIKHGGRAKVFYGIPLDKKLTRFEYRALCLEQLDQVKSQDVLFDITLGSTYYQLKQRYHGAIFINEKISMTSSLQYYKNLAASLKTFTPYL